MFGRDADYCPRHGFHEAVSAAELDRRYPLGPHVPRGYIELSPPAEQAQPVVVPHASCLNAAAPPFVLLAAAPHFAALQQPVYHPVVVPYASGAQEALLARNMGIPLAGGVPSRRYVPLPADQQRLIEEQKEAERAAGGGKRKEKGKGRRNGWFPERRWDGRGGPGGPGGGMGGGSMGCRV
jgi:hypothetical protein